jgi:hypothetical protein
MWQKERGEPPCGCETVEKMKYGVENGIKEKCKGTNHYHDLESHNEKDNDADAGCNLRYYFLNFGS